MGLMGYEEQGGLYVYGSFELKNKMRRVLCKKKQNRAT
jgi:hypothetical protein